ncbi:MAG: hypothetical protein M1828_002828 [Chrysothrix sp. TS-e1954]|nr:MAG: hypothetical protein M1828_002828 [Chrysothrix sp. TS-e1954]
MGREEQKEEREVLDSIFPDEITGDSPIAPKIRYLHTKLCADVSETEYRISITLEAPSDHAENAPDPPSFVLQVSLPETYPDTPPNLDVHPSPNHPKHPYFDLSIDKPVLLAALDEPVSENLGMAMIFTLVTSIKEAAEQLVAERVAAVQDAQEAERARAEEEENRKFQGEAVTKERFLEWRLRFRREMDEKDREEREQREAEEKKKRGGKAEEKKLTGRDLFQKGLAGKAMEDEEDEESDDAVEQVNRLKV